MVFEKHSDLIGQHAILSASKYHWVNYDVDKMIATYKNYQAVQYGTEIHDLACRLIKNGIRLPKNSHTLNMYVNDGIAYRMNTEQVLYFSRNWFGTADAISFRNDILRIHDLKTGDSSTSFIQLEIYAALFCLEYKVDPKKIDMELRIYQNNEMSVKNPEPETIIGIMNKGKLFDKEIEKLRKEEEGI